MTVIFNKWHLQLICCVSDSIGTNTIDAEIRKHNLDNYNFELTIPKKQKRTIKIIS